MERLFWGIVWVGVIALVLWLMWRAWKVKMRAAQGLGLPEIPEQLGERITGFAGQYVVTTLANQQLERLAIPGLAFRGNAFVTVHPEGIAIVIAGGVEAFIAAYRVTGAGFGNWTIDRVVEENGMVLVSWEHGGKELDTWFRPASPVDGQRFVEAVQGLVKDNNDFTANDAVAPTTQKEERE